MKTPLVIPMPNEVNTLDDVKKFFTDLKAAGYAFHPDDDFTEYSNTSIDTGKLLNVIMQRCWVICEDLCEGDDDIYTIGMNILYPERHNEAITDRNLFM